LIALSIIIFILTVVPLTAWVAIPLIVIFVATAAFVSSLLIGMKIFLGIDGYVVPSMKCFDKNT
jgi:hypothetical protein